MKKFALILIIVYLETGFFLGFVLPGGDYMLFATGMLSASFLPDIPLLLIVLSLVTASFLGDLTGYFKGRWLGSKLFTGNKSRFFKIEYIEKGNSFYEKYGMRAFIIGRYLPVIRTLVPMIAGASEFKLNKFLIYNLLGATTWVGTLVPLGYFIGETYPDAINYSIYFIIIFAAIASFPVIKILLSGKKVKL